MPIFIRDEHYIIWKYMRKKATATTTMAGELTK